MDSVSVYSDPWIRVRVDSLLRPDGSSGAYSVVELKGGIGVVVADDANRILLVGQFRYAVREYSWEIPKGAFLDFESKEDPLGTAKRELEEETGVSGDEWTLIGRVHTLLGSTNDEVFLFAVKGLRLGDAHPEESEFLELKWVEKEEFWKMVRAGEITDATSIAALAMYRNR